MNIFNDMLTKDQIIEKIKELLPKLKRDFKVKKIGLFGSYSNGTQTEDSDIDLIVEFEQPIGLAFMDMIDVLENTLNKKVDVLTPEGIKSIRVNDVAEQIIKSVIYV